MQRRFTKGFRALVAWQEAKALTLKIYRLTKTFPKEELFGLTSQLRRAASSIIANLAEGSAMPTKGHRDAYYYRARGSCTEVDNFSELTFELQYISEKDFNDLSDHCARIIYLITRLAQ